MKTEKIKISLIKLNPDNPRLIKNDKFKALVKSIKEFPEMLKLRPIVINKDNMILGGNMRLRACQEAGLKDVPVIRAETLTEAQQKEFIIKDNSNYGEWNFDLLANEWDGFPLADWGVDVPDMSIPSNEDWAEAFEHGENTGRADGIKQITFVLPDNKITELLNILKPFDKNKDLAMAKIINKWASLSNQ